MQNLTLTLVQIDPQMVVSLPPLWVLVLSTLIPLLPAAAVHPSSGDNRLRWIIAGLASILLALSDQLLAQEGFTLEGLITTSLISGITFFFAQDGMSHFNVNGKVLPSRGLIGRADSQDHVFKSAA